MQMVLVALALVARTASEIGIGCDVRFAWRSPHQEQPFFASIDANNVQRCTRGPYRKKGKFMLCITLRQQVAFFVFLLIIIMSCVCLCMCANVNMGSHAKNSYIIPYKIWWVVALFSFHTECGNSLALCASRMNRLCISEVYNMNGQRMGPCLWRKWLLPFHFYCAVGLVRVLHIFSIM